MNFKPWHPWIPAFIVVGVVVGWLLLHAVWVAANCTTVLGTQVCR